MNASEMVQVCAKEAEAPKGARKCLCKTYNGQRVYLLVYASTDCTFCHGSGEMVLRQPGTGQTAGDCNCIARRVQKWLRAHAQSGGSTTAEPKEPVYEPDVAVERKRLALRRQQVLLEELEKERVADVGGLERQVSEFDAVERVMVEHLVAAEAQVESFVDHTSYLENKLEAQLGVMKDAITACNQIQHEVRALGVKADAMHNGPLAEIAAEVKRYHASTDEVRGTYDRIARRWNKRMQPIRAKVDRLVRRLGDDSDVADEEETSPSA